MWIAKLKLLNDGTVIGSRTGKYNVDVFAFHLAYHHGKDCVFVQAAGTMHGKDEDKKALVKELKNDKRVLNFELNGDFFVSFYKLPGDLKMAYNKDIIRLAPNFISSKGFQTVEVGSFKRDSLARLIRAFKRKYKAELLSIKQSKVKSFYFVKAHPELTGKQKNAIQLAIKNGYYECPRGTDLPKLAKHAGISYSTFQAHIRKAEHKLIPFFFEH